LGVEAIDLYQMHGWDPLTPVEETLSFLDAAAHAGKIHYVSAAPRPSSPSFSRHACCLFRDSNPGCVSN
jgi:aryl-alcohol dehydrogenase-like predicted oxidoreductase